MDCLLHPLAYRRKRQKKPPGHQDLVSLFTGATLSTYLQGTGQKSRDEKFGVGKTPEISLLLSPWERYQMLMLMAESHGPYGVGSLALLLAFLHPHLCRRRGSTLHLAARQLLIPIIAWTPRMARALLYVRR